MSASKLAVVFLMSMICATSAAPFLVRLRRSTVDQTSDDSKMQEDKATRQDKSLDVLGLTNFLKSSTADDNSNQATVESKRQNKALPYYDFLPQLFAADDDYADEELNLERIEQNDDEDLSRTIPSRRKPNPYKDFSNTNSISYDNSPIYYIRLPPTPYMFVPGLGYISQPPSVGPPVPPPVNPFINVPIEFVSNGKPTNVYQWNGAPTYQAPAVNPYNQLFSRPQVSRPSRPNDYSYQKPNKKPVSDTKLTSINKGPYVFNGKPSDIFVLRDSYNSLYSDALTNFYP
ncbi:uncharacterized protein LOC143920797 [Arctopsyche grandis]|uniref:uncharacterized protein LOC143920797 n=1 Tax=Arctopsyche grandis TaxID=121162 RepID=UPI00406D8202